MRHTDLSAFYNRNLKQGDNLIKALFGYHQQLYPDPETVAALLSAKHIGDMSSENPHARNLWFRCLAKQLCKCLETDKIGDIPQVPVYMLSIAAGEYTNDLNRNEPITHNKLKSVVAEYKRMISPQINFLGMVEPGLYVSSNDVFHTNRACNLHVHGIAWGCYSQNLQTLCEQIRKDVWCSVPYLSPAHSTRVNEGDLAQVLWYCTKFPNKQYQLWRRPTGIKQFKRQINGVNAVRLYHQMSHIRLDELTFGQGWGDTVIARASRSYVRQAKKRQLP